MEIVELNGNSMNRSKIIEGIVKLDKKIFPKHELRHSSSLGSRATSSPMKRDEDSSPLISENKLDDDDDDRHLSRDRDRPLFAHIYSLWPHFLDESWVSFQNSKILFSFILFSFILLSFILFFVVAGLIAMFSVFHRLTVLDVGTGSGILAIRSAQAGARKVYAVEATKVSEHARALVRANKLQDVVEVTEGSMEDVTLPEKVDIIISEWMGYFLLRESMFDSVICARDRWLKPTGVTCKSFGGTEVQVQAPAY